VEIEIPIVDDLFEKTRRYAEANGTTVEQLIREFVENFARQGAQEADTQST
jgi:hypothetical protein